MAGYLGDGFLISSREVTDKMSKMSLLRQKLFRLKEKQKITKTEWPELVGKDAEEATTIIDKEQPGLKIQIIPENHYVIKDLEEKRVRLFVDKKQIVIKTPHIG